MTVDRCYPCVSIHNAGTVSYAAGTLTGVGTKWTSQTVDFLDDALLRIPATGGNAHMLGLTTLPASDTSWALTSATNHTDVGYAIARRCPFAVLVQGDGAAHEGLELRRGRGEDPGVQQLAAASRSGAA